MGPLPELLTRAEVAGVFRIAPETLDDWARQGRISSVRLPSGQRRYRREDIEQAISDGIEAAS